MLSMVNPSWLLPYYSHVWVSAVLFVISEFCASWTVAVNILVCPGMMMSIVSVSVNQCQCRTNVNCVCVSAEEWTEIVLLHRKQVVGVCVYRCTKTTVETLKYKSLFAVPLVQSVEFKTYINITDHMSIMCVDYYIMIRIIDHVVATVIKSR